MTGATLTAGATVDAEIVATPGSVTNGSAAGVTIASLTTTLAGSPSSYVVPGFAAGLQVAASGLNFVTTSIPVDIRYQDFLFIDVGATSTLLNATIELPPATTINFAESTGSGAPVYSEGIAGFGRDGAILTLNSGSGLLNLSTMNVSVQATQQLAIPVVENGSATISGTRTPSGTLTLQELNDATEPLSTSQSNYVCTITGSGGVPPYNYQIMGKSPYEIDPNTGICVIVGYCVRSGTTSTLGGVQGTHFWAGNTQSCSVRIQDSTGAYGYLTVTTNISAFAGGSTSLSTIIAAIAPNSIVFDPANATTSGSTVTGLTATYNGSGSYAVVAPSGAPVTTIGSVTGPDSVAKNTLRFANVLNNLTPALAAGAAYSGSSSSLAGFMASSNINNTPGTMICVLYDPTAATTTSLTQYALCQDGTVGSGTANGLFMAASTITSKNASGSTLTNFYSLGGNIPPSAWTVYSLVADGSQAYAEDGNFAYQALTSATLARGLALPATSSFTPNMVGLGIARTAATGGHTCALVVMANYAWTEHQREQLYTVLARLFPVPVFTPKARFVITQSSLVQPIFSCTNFNQLFGTNTYIPNQFLNYAENNPVAVQSLYPGQALYIGDWAAGVHATFPEYAGYVEQSTGAMVMPARQMTLAQATYAANSGASFTNPTAAITSASWSGGQATFGGAFSSTLISDIKAGTSLVYIVNTNATGGAGYNGLWQTVSINATTLVVNMPNNPGTYTNGGLVFLYTYRGTQLGFKHVLSQQYGIFQCRYQFTNGAGMWPDPWWSYRASINTPQEIDGSEGLGVGNGATTFSVHYSTASGNVSTTYYAYCDNQAANPQTMLVHWYDNFNGTCTVDYYLNRRLYFTSGPLPNSSFNQPMFSVMDIACGGSGGTIDQYTPPLWLAKVFSWKFWAPVNSDNGQMPLLGGVGAFTGTRGNGNTISCANPTGSWFNSSNIKSWTWTTYSPQTGQSATIATSTTGPISLTDLTAYQGLTLIYTIVVNNGTSGSPNYFASQGTTATTQDNPWIAVMDVGVVPTASLTLTNGSQAHGQAQGAVLGGFYNQALGAKFSITSSDTTGNFQIGPDGIQLQVGPNGSALAAGTYTVYATQTTFSGLTLAQTFSITLT